VTGDVVAGGEQHELAETFASIAVQLLGTGDVEQTLQRIVSLAVVTIDGCEHAGVSLLVDGQLETAAQSDEIPAILAEIQNRTGEGPCVDAAFERHDVYDSGDLSSDPRWPRFTAEAGERTNIHSALGTCLRVGGEVRGALDLYATARDAFDDDARGMAAIFAAHAAMGLAGARQRERLHREIDTRDLIGQAKGIIMVRSGVDDETALALLRDSSSRMHRRLSEVARQVVEGELEL
jgi:GAF domain-containing protein